jgi:hypothetical protein
LALSGACWLAAQGHPGAQAGPSQPPAVGEENPYASTFAAEGTAADTLLLMHNRRGLRIELDLDKRALDLWISPGAGRSLDYRDRNFSNRDDHTSVFDRIGFPRLERAAFQGCDYDPFVSVLRFRDQTLHIATLFDRPVVLVWFGRPSAVDLKADKQDRLVTRTERAFEIEHPDRGRSFRFAAALGPGEGVFEHQRDVDAGRSSYARAILAPGQVLALAGELESEPVREWAREAADTPVERSLREVESRVEAALAPGRIRLRGRPELQRLLDINRRAVLSMQDESGAIRAAVKYIYYLIWVRDGAVTTVPAAYAGWSDPLTRWTRFLLANPAVTEYEPRGRFFGQLVNGKITKWEEDGLFYAVWSAFAEFSQTGDRSAVSPEHLEVLREATDWLERYAFDRSRGLFGRYHDGETPFTGSRGDGWDDAVGSPTERFRVEVRGRTVTRSYDLPTNLQLWGVYRMLAAMDAERAAGWEAKARALEARLRPWLASRDALPGYGELSTVEGDSLRATLFEIGLGDSLWALCLTPFAGEVFDLAALRRRLALDDEVRKKSPYLATQLSLAGSLDTEWGDEATILAALDRATPEAARPGRYLPMAYAAPEVLGVEDGHPYHDVRPQAFSIGPWLWATANLGVRRLPFGVAVRANSALEGIDGYEYRRSRIDLRCEGQGAIEQIILNGRPLAHTLQIPEWLLVEGTNTLTIRQGADALAGPVLASSTVRLESVEEQGRASVYRLEAFGASVLVFRGRPAVDVRDDTGRRVAVTSRTSAGHTAIVFEGRGRYQVSVR